MEVSSKQKYKRRKTRKMRDETKKRIRDEIKNNVNRKNEGILKFNNIRRYGNNEQITSNRLTLALFNKTVISETITRPSITQIAKKVDNTVKNSQHGEKMNNTSDYIILTSNNKDLEMKSPEGLIDFSRNINVDVNTASDRPTLFSPLKPATDEEDCISQISPGMYDTISSCSSIERPGNCLYEKFMNGLPKYLKENFPTLFEDSVINKNTVFLKQHYLRNCHSDIENNGLNICTSRDVINDSKHNKDSIIENPMDYIEMGLSWQLSVKKKKNSLVSSNSSSSLSQLEINSSNMFIQDSPEYVYFPHKLNQ